MSWIDLLFDATDEAETPRSFIWWAGICSIAAVVSPNVYLNKGGKYHLHPNIYCLLIAKSGLGKGLPISIFNKLVGMTDSTRLITGRNTIQSIIKDLSVSQTDEHTGLPKFKDARAAISSGEFAASIQRDQDLFTMLTDIYNTHEFKDRGYPYKTISGGLNYLKAPCITLFSGSSPEHLNDYVADVNIRGGFIARTLLVYEEKRWKINPLDDEDAPDIDFELLSAHLRGLKTLSGKFHWTPEARKLYREWYHEFRSEDHDDKTGTSERFPDHVLKVAMCVSLARGVELIIRPEDWTDALKQCAKLQLSIKALTGGVGKSPMAAMTKVALELILKAEDYTITRQKLLQQGWGDFNSSELDTIVEHLIQAGFIEQSGTKDITYRVSKRGQEIWKAKQKEVV